MTELSSDHPNQASTSAALTTGAPALTTGPCFRISLIRGEHVWQFRWEPGGESALIDHIAELARDPNSPFDWFDAAAVCKHIARPITRRNGANASNQS